MVSDTASEPDWIDGGPRFWYLAARADRTEFVVVDPQKGEKKLAFDHTKLARALAKASGEEIDPKALPFTRVRLDGGKVRCRAFARAWVFDPTTDTIAPDLGPAAPRPRPRAATRTRARASSILSPSPGRQVRSDIDLDFNVIIRNRDTDAAVTLTTDGTDRDPYLPEFYWSPDSTKLVVMREAAADRPKATVVESAPPGGGRPRTVSYDQPHPADKLARRRPRLFDVRDGAPIDVPETLFGNPFDVSCVRWDRNAQRFTFLYNPRGHPFLRMVAVDGNTGRARVLFEERSKSFVDYYHKLFVRHLDATDEILWASERDGWNHLYLLDAGTGSVKKQLTKGEWLVRRVDRIDAAARCVWFWAHGVRPEQDPYHLHYCRVNLDGTGLVVLTEGDGTHEVWTSPDRTYFVDSYSRVDRPPVTELRRLTDGKLVLKLETADLTALLKAGWRVPNASWPRGATARPTFTGSSSDRPISTRTRSTPWSKTCTTRRRGSTSPRSSASCTIRSRRSPNSGSSAW